jgi:cell shape-determining protein MreC
MIYIQQGKKRKSALGLVGRLIVSLAVLYGIYFFFGNYIASGTHMLQRSAAYMFGFYDYPVRPVAENAYVVALETENSQLKELLNRAPENNDKELAVVLSRPPHTPYDSLIIDMGEDHGLAPGDLVYADMNYLLGHVETVHLSSSVVELFSSPGEKIEVLLGSSTTPVIAEGRGSGNFFIKVPRNIEVKEGDPIIVPSLRSLVLGTAEKVDSGEGEAYAYIYFKLAVNLNSLRYVQVKKAVR